ncbi:MAG: adenosylcobinamide-GDP ribazoletransferase [Actinomycetota bacterium]|nr:adenosylcobinamide-GDP ribazoletransferase [Actinomycetota bacterium]
MAGTVPTAAAVASTAVLAGLTLVWGLVLIPVAAPALVVTPLVGIAAALLLLRRARARLSGVTGDVLGAGVETATTATFVAAVLVLT